MSACRLVLGALSTVLFLGLLPGCERAHRYGKRTQPAVSQKDQQGKTKDDRKVDSLAQLQWEPPNLALVQKDVRLVFVHASAHPKKWTQLKSFWNELDPRQVASLVTGSNFPLMGLNLITAGTLAAQPAIQIKVPLGLDDPTLHIPLSNPPTLGKWRLGKQLFFDDRYLASKDSTSCVGCHDPEQGYTDGRSRHGNFNTPTLINCGFQRHYFWDGRARTLEGMLAQCVPIQDKPTTRSFPHAWPGVIERLRKDQEYTQQFEEVFGTKPTQDAYAKALATYLRTVLSANSLHDRAVHEARNRGLRVQVDQADYEKLLDSKTMQRLTPTEKPSKSQVAAALVRGYRVFHGKGQCYRCHLGGQLTDNEFHVTEFGPARLEGRLASLPVGLKDRRFKGAFKTPTLRLLSLTGPYRYNGSAKTLRMVIEHYATEHIPDLPERISLEPEEIKALLLFLNALKGEPVDPHVANEEEHKK